VNTRRTFLFDCSVVITAVSLFPFPVAGTPLISSGRSLDDLSYSDFAAQVGTKFWVRLEPMRTAELDLLKARRAPLTPRISSRHPPGDSRHERFSLILSGPKDELLQPAIHRFEHPKLGRFEMFISRIGVVDAAGFRYEAVFNRPVRTGTRRGWLQSRNA
jgi:hypothetical protein